MLKRSARSRSIRTLVVLGIMAPPLTSLVTPAHATTGPSPGVSITQATGGALRGDTSTDGPAYSRILKYIKAPGAPDYVLGAAGVPQVTGGQDVSYRLNPSLSSAAERQDDHPTDVVVEDCLPTGQSLTTASPTPAVVSATTPAGAGITCGAGETYLKWDLGQRVPDQEIGALYYDVHVSPTIPEGTYTNTALVTACGEDDTDAADVRLRESSAQVQVVRAEGLRIDNTALTPYVEVNRPGETTGDPLQWRIDLANVSSAGQISEPDVIDQLPTVGVRGTDDNGSLRFVSATDDANDTNVTIWYTSSPNLSLDPADPSNAAGGSTLWCDAPSGGSPVPWEASGDRATPADCPQTAADVTGLRIRADGDTRDVPSLSGDVLSVTVEMLPSDNLEGDVYDNCLEGRVTGRLADRLGPLCAPEYVVASRSTPPA